MNDDILSIYIGEDDLIDWTMITGKDVMMVELLKSIELLLYNDLDEIRCVNIFVDIVDETVKMEFTLKPYDINESLSKILEWAIESEEYEMCTRVKKLQDFVND
jgi:hypothetical protein